MCVSGDSWKNGPSVVAAELGGVDQSPVKLLPEAPALIARQCVEVLAGGVVLLLPGSAAQDRIIGDGQLAVPAEVAPEGPPRQLGELAVEDPGVHQVEPLGPGGGAVAFGEFPGIPGRPAEFVQRPGGHAAVGQSDGRRSPGNEGEGLRNDAEEAFVTARERTQRVAEQFRFQTAHGVDGEIFFVLGEAAGNGPPPGLPRTGTEDEMEQIVGLLLNDLSKRAKDQLGIDIRVPRSVRRYIVKKHENAKMGARPLKRAVQTEIEDLLAQDLLTGKFGQGAVVTFAVKNDKIVIEEKKAVRVKKTAAATSKRSTRRKSNGSDR